MLSEIDIYIDEFGNAHLDLSKQGTFSHFVYTAVVIRRENVQEAHKIRYEISRDFLQGHPIKSSSRSFSNNDKGFNKRIQVLKKLRNLDFTIFSLVVDKKKIKSDGLVFKQVFYKYFSKIFLRNFAKQYDSFRIFADRLGYPEFQRSLKQYVYDNAIQKDLFHQNRSYELVEDTEEEPLIQLADFLCGCMGKIYCLSHSHSRSDELFELLHDRMFVDYFPYKNSYYEGSVPVENKLLNSQIAQIAYKNAIEFLQTKDKEKVSREAVEVLKYLMLMFRSFPDKLIETHELVNKVKALNKDYNKDTLRTDIQALRDHEILIASIIGKSGYKIPNKEEDMIGFYNLYMRSVIPMLKRIEISNSVLQKKSVNDINLLSSKYDLDILKRLINVINE